MINEVRISNFKGIKSCQVKDLRRVNLFIGKNDSGKSSILEAIFHTCKEFISPNLHRIMGRRTDVFTGGRELWFGYDTEETVDIALSFDNFGVSLRFNREGDNIITILGAERSLPATRTPWSSRARGSEYSIHNLTPVLQRPQSGLNLLDKMRTLKPLLRYAVTKHFRNADLIDCRRKAQLSTVESSLGQIKLDLKDEEFGDILRKIYGKGKHWEFLPHPDSPTEKRIAFREGEKRYFLSDFGDGFRFGLSICATAMTLRGTAIFIEEIENHQHSGSLKQLILNLVGLSRENDLQLFITTHSKDVWNSFSRVLYKEDPEKEKEEFRCILVNRDFTSGVVTAKATDSLHRITQALGQI